MASTEAAELRSCVEIRRAMTPTSYISHGELLDGRATDLNTWSPSLDRLLEEDVRVALAGTDGCRLAVAVVGGQIQGAALVQRQQAGDRTYLLLHDIAVASGCRDRGIGGQMMHWLKERAREDGVHALMCESGIANQPAHDFIERAGFAVISKTFLMEL